MLPEHEIDPTGKPLYTASEGTKGPAPEDLISPGPPAEIAGSIEEGAQPGAPYAPEEETQDPQEDNNQWYKVELEKTKQELKELKQAREEKATRQADPQLTPQELKIQRLKARQEARRRKVW